MDATLTFRRIKAKQIEHEATDDGQIGPGVFFARSHLVIVQGDIKTLVDAIFDAPMSPHDIGQRVGLGRNAADVEAALPTRLAVDRVLGLDHPDLDAYLNEFVFRFNRRSSRSRGLLFYRLLEQANEANRSYTTR